MTTSGLRVLVVDDEAHNREALVEVLARLGHEATAAADGREALEKASVTAFDLVLSDVRMPNLDGLQFFDAFRKLAPPEALPPFVFMTAYGRLEEAVEAMRKGALHFLTKPIRKKDIVAVLQEAELGRRQAASRAAAASHAAPRRHRAVFASRAFGDAVALIDRVAATTASVLLVGESGTGKEVLARRLHEMSSRAAGPFVAFHGGAMPETLLESELFGHEKGAFTGAEQARLGRVRAAHRGTFFLDELSSMPIGVQAKLLRVIQERAVTPLGATAPIECDVRWVAATNVALEGLVEQGRFREDLLYRLRVVVVELKPLRERPEDIAVLTDAFMAELCEEAGREPLGVSDEVRLALLRHPWPGNARELRNVIERAIALADGPVLTPELLPTHLTQSAQARELRVAVGSSLQSVEDRLIEETLKSCGGDKAQAAAILGVAPRTIYRWIEKRTQPPAPDAGPV